MPRDGRTEKATPRRRRESRKEGQVLRSKEFNNLMTYGAFFIGIYFFQPHIANMFFEIMTMGLELIELGASPKEIVISLLSHASTFLILLYVLVTFFVIVSYVSQVGFLVSLKAVTPDFKRINPANYWKNIANVRKSGFEVAKNIILFIVIFSFLFSIFKGNVQKIQGVLLLGWLDSIVLFSDMFKELVLKLGIIFLIIGIADYLFQKWEYEKSLRMKKEEVEDERKEQDGDPMIRAQQRAARERILEKRIKESVLDAQLVIVNPTHYSVAIRYKKEKEDFVPRVILKGINEMALLIRKIAEENEIPVIENKTVARKVYDEVEEDDFINEELYEVVGKIIATLVKDGKLNL